MYTAEIVASSLSGPFEERYFNAKAVLVQWRAQDSQLVSNMLAATITSDTESSSTIERTLPTSANQGGTGTASSSTSASSSDDSDTSSSLTTPAKAGIGVGIPVFTVAVIALAVWALRRRSQRRRAMQSREAQGRFEKPELDSIARTGHEHGQKYEQKNRADDRAFELDADESHRSRIYEVG